MTQAPLGLEALLAQVMARTSRDPVVAFVGAGGKTSSMFALARAFALRGPSGDASGALSPPRVLVATTTRILNPDRATPREGQSFGALVLEVDPSTPEALRRLEAAGTRVVLGSSLSADGLKLMGVGAETLCAAASIFDMTVVEADGARGLSIKAPSGTEPVVPFCATSVVGLIGLDALGKPLDSRIAHRPEMLGPLVGCALREPIRPEHLLHLALAPGGLFKGAPRGSQRIILLNKADAAPESAEACASLLRSSGAADAVVVGALGAPSDWAGGTGPQKPMGIAG